MKYVPPASGHEADTDEAGNERPPRPMRCGCRTRTRARAPHRRTRRSRLRSPASRARGSRARSGGTSRAGCVPTSGDLLELRQILSRAEAAARAGDDDRADLGIARLLQRVVEAGVERAVERVQHVRAIERDRLYRAVARRPRPRPCGGIYPAATVAAAMPDSATKSAAVIWSPRKTEKPRVPRFCSNGTYFAAG